MLHQRSPHINRSPAVTESRNTVAVRAASQPAQHDAGHCECLERGLVSRRHISALLAASAWLPLWAPATSQAAAGPAEPTWKLAFKLTSLAESQQASTARCTPALAPQLAAAFTKAVYDAVLDLQVVAAADFQREAFRLRDQEYPYYYAAYQDRLPRVPDLADQSGGLSNPAYFNFLYYILWKVAASKVKGDQGRRQLQRSAALSLLTAIAPETLEQAAAAGRRGGPATEGEVAGWVDLLLQRLQAGGYCCEYQVIWGYSGGELPRSWFLEQGGVVGQPPSATEPAAGVTFQLRVHQPADIEGAVALRGEEDGFWAAALPCMVSELLAEAGVRVEAQDEFFFQDEWGGPRSWQDRVLLVLGDPLQRVEVPWEPTSLVMSWQLA